MGLLEGEAYRRKEPRKSTSFHFRRVRRGRYFLSGHVRRNRRAEAPPMGPLGEGVVSLC